MTYSQQTQQHQHYDSTHLPSLEALLDEDHVYSSQMTRKDSISNSFMVKTMNLSTSRKSSLGRSESLTHSLLGQENEEGQTSIQVGVNMTKCVVGGGSFNLPQSFKFGGLWLSFAATIGLGWLCAYTINLLALCERKLCHELRLQGRNVSKLTYAQVGKEAFPRFGMLMQVIIYAGIILTSLGVCAAYVVFVSKAVSDLSGHYFTDFQSALLLTPILILLSWLRDFRFLAFTSILGDIAVTSGLVTVLIFGFMYHQITWDLPAARFDTFPRYFAGTAFLFCIHAVTLPLMQTMKKTSEFPKATNWSFGFITILNAIFGALGYMLFGENVEDNVISNLSGGGFVAAIQILISVDLFFTVPMVLASSREIIEAALFTDLPQYDTWAVCWTRNFIRGVLVCAFVAIALFVNNFGAAIGLVGGFTNSITAFVLPPLIYMKLQHESKKLTVASFIGHTSIIILGLVGLVASTYMTIEAIIQDKSKSGH
eukprot:GILI01015365.1.p1 GENE.GILI01015365.1~~GILI01015365.1.p1  ORF type:complete len:483 (+),score=120.73 GILI01015365.1:155-1603(+)